MRLINALTKRLENFYSEPPEPYAILSHTWGPEDQELSFQDMQALDSCPSTRRLKLDLCCGQACKDRIKYIWIDTCCIDKTNAVELGEAINSMFRWYQKSAICYAYLSDIESGQYSQVGNSRWFTRGWTLQELLAPRKIAFFDSGWSQLGTRSSMSVVIAEATGIPHHILTGIGSLQTCSVAQRMSWASRRTTTRPEDMAYCLLGIFDVMIPPIYGEGLERAFWRLQEQIMKKTADDSILAWSWDPFDDRQPERRAALPHVSGGVLATSPTAFKQCGDIVQRPQQRTRTHIQSIDIFGGVMSISLSLADASAVTPAGSSSLIVYGYLSCGPKSNPLITAAIPLAPCDKGSYGDGKRAVFFRPHGFNTLHLSAPSSTQHPLDMLIRNDRPGDIATSSDTSYWIYLPPRPYPWDAQIDEVYPPDCFEHETAMIKTPKEHQFDADDTLFMVRFSYPSSITTFDDLHDRPKMNYFVLALRFFRDSSTGAVGPLPYLYFDHQHPPTPLEDITKLWRSLALTGTRVLTTSARCSSPLRVSVSKDTIDRHPLWVVDLVSIPFTEANNPLDWPDISDQISLRTDICHVMKCLWDRTKSSERYRQSVGEVARSETCVAILKNELERVNAQMASLMTQAEKLEQELNNEVNHKVSLQGSAQSFCLARDTAALGVSTKTLQTLCPRYLQASLSETESQERDGVMSHIMQNLPIIHKGERLNWVPGMTLLMYAAATGVPEMIKEVLQYDFDFRARDSEGRTVKDWASAAGFDWKMLLKAASEEQGQSDFQTIPSIRPESWTLGLSPAFPKLPDLSQAFKGGLDSSWELPYPRTDDDPLGWVSAILNTSSMGSQDINPSKDAPPNPSKKSDAPPNPSKKSRRSDQLDEPTRRNGTKSEKPRRLTSPPPYYRPSIPSRNQGLSSRDRPSNSCSQSPRNAEDGVSDKTTRKRPKPPSRELRISEIGNTTKRRDNLVGGRAGAGTWTEFFDG